MQRRLILLMAGAALLASACVSQRHNQGTPPTAQADTPPRSTSALPDGSGGVRKTGNPYRVAGQWYYPMQAAGAYDETGVASWYGRDFHGKDTANGERYDMHALSAAHKTLPMPTLVRVTNLENGRAVVVRVNDRGPFVKSRLIDLSYAAARELGFDTQGTARVRVQTLDQPAPTQAASQPMPRNVQPASPALVAFAWADPGPAAKGAIYVQLGAFSSEINAMRLRDALNQSFANVLIQPRHLSGQTLYRVRIGPFEDMRNIENTVQTLQHNGYDNAVVIIE